MVGMARLGAAALVLVAKPPRLGVGKQRLAARLGAESALAMARALWDCALEDAQAWQGQVLLALPDDVQTADYAFPVIKQGEGNLGQRLNHIDRQVRALGYMHLLYIGMDAPLLTTQDYQQVLAELAVHDVVLKPARDGGVVMMAAARPWPDLQHLPWSADQLCTQLSQLCLQHSLTLTTTATGYDIDVIEDLLMAEQDLMADSRPARQALLRLIQTCRF